ncbi:MAG TPA: efflux RND transporter periplasmic adaptor subunit [Xanthobacteraceae bacterium]|nr:efflux RND transporter periplasmic adaptor subunit [Xanthobacteraceae bacterium]
MRVSEPTRSVLSRRGLRIAGMAVAASAAVIVGTGISSRKMADARLSEWTESQAVPVVAVATPDLQGKSATLDLPGRIEAYSQAQIYARVSGYLKAWNADIGAPVKAGQLLAEIDAPDLDQQILQAQADLSSAQANAVLAEATLQRGQSLIKSGAVTKQDLDQRTADSANRQGLLNAAQANLDRLRVLEQYKRIVAPFDGLVTQRTTDVGALINAGASGGPALFVVSDTSKLRLYVNVPQNYVPSIKVGTRAKLSVPEYPGRTFTATVNASAQSVDVASGTTRMQLLVDNADGELMTGAFADVQLDLAHPAIAINVPASALVVDQNGVHVATVGPDDRVVLKPVTIARDLGKVVEVGSGLNAEDRVIESPPDGIASGDAVRIAVAQGTKLAPETASAKRLPAKPPG